MFYLVCCVSIRNNDPIFKMATPVRPDEESSFTTKSLSLKPADIKPEQENAGSDMNVMEAARQEDEESEEDEKEEKVTGDCQPIGEEGFCEMTQPSGDGREESSMPGWFGKGCRKKTVKRVGKRRRSRVTSVESDLCRDLEVKNINSVDSQLIAPPVTS